MHVIYDQVSGRSKGFGFVTMSSELDGRALRVNVGPPPPRLEESSYVGPREGSGERSFDNTNRVYVGNLDLSALENLFREQGNVLDAKEVYDRSGLVHICLSHLPFLIVLTIC
ncbi:putative RNA-binding domain superfamily [Helianthus annuus]|nr:putative RNA-binding domain superfamily [Helianthus annuus]